MTEDHNVILHIGGPKCGSSSIQNHLSMNPTFTSDDGAVSYRYVALCGGRIIDGDDLTLRARLSPEQYLASDPARLLDMDETTMRTCRDQITKLTRDGTTLVLSCEGWGHSGRKFNRLDLLERLGLRPEVVYFVRPPLDWLNAAWWQWGAWTGLSFEEWLEEQGSRGIAWDTHAANWQRLAAVRHLHLRVMTADVVRSFGQILGCTWSSPDHTNTGSPELLLRYLQEDRSLRPDEHNSIIEFILNRWVDWPERRAPWIIPRHLQEEIMSTYSPHAERLLALASPESRPSIEKDERWWSAEPYEQRDIDDDIRQLTPDERDVLIRALIDGIANLDRKYRQLDSSGG